MTDEFLHQLEADIYMEVADYESTVDAQYYMAKDGMAESKGQDFDAYSQAMKSADEQTQSTFWKGLGYAADKILTPFTAFGDAILAPVAHQYDEGEGIGTALKISGDAFLKTLIPFYGDDDQPHYAKQIVDGWMDDDASELQKTSMAFGLDLISDPTILLGTGALKFAQNLFRAGGSLKKMKNMRQMAMPNMAQKIGSAFDGTIGTSEEAIIRMYKDAGENMTPLGKHLQRRARNIDRTGNKQEYVKLIDELDKHEEIKDLANLTSIKETEDFIKDVTIKLGASGTALAHFDTRVSKGAIARSIHNNVSPLTNTNFNLPLLTGASSAQKAIGVIHDAHKSNFNSYLKTLSKTEKEVALGAQDKQLLDLIRTPIKDIGRSDMYAMRMTLVSLGELTTEAAAMALKGNPMGDVLLRNYLGLTGIMLRKTAGVSRLWGSQLRSLKITPGVADVKSQYLAMKQIVDSTVQKDWKYNRLLKKLVVAGKNPGVVIPLMEGSITGKKTLNALFEIFVNSILSSPLTHAVNLTSTAVRMAMEPLTSGLASVNAIANFRFADASEHFRDIYNMTGGFMEGVSEAFRLGTRKLSNKRLFKDFNYPVRIGPDADMAKIMYNPAIKSENYGLTGVIGKAVDIFGYAVRVPGSALMGEDTFMKMIAYRMKLNTYASKWARESGKNFADRKALYRVYKKHPPLSLNKMAMKDADEMLFHKRLGKVGESVNATLKITPGVRWMIPFFRTPTNLVKEGVRHTPFGLMYKEMRSKVMMANADGDLVRAKLVMGPLMAGSIMSLMGENITGDIDTKSPSGKFLNEQGRNKYTITFAGEYEFSYANIEPLRFMIGMFAKLRDISTNADMNDPNEEPIAKAAFNTVIGAFVGTAFDNYMLQNVGQIVNILDAAANGNSDAFLEAIQDIIVSGSTPQMVAQWNKQKSKYFIQADTFMEKFRKRIWGISPGLYHHRNAFGEKIEVPHGTGPPGEFLNSAYESTWSKTFDAYSPLRFRRHKIHPVSQAIIDLGIPIKGPVKQIKGIPLLNRPDLRDRVNKLAGGVGDYTVKKTLIEYMNMPVWETISDASKKKVIMNVFNSSRSNAKRIVFSESKWLQEQWIAQKQKDAEIASQNQ